MKSDQKPKIRCKWADSDPLLAKYHDAEWGLFTADDKKHYEHLVLEAAQAGLSWLTVLKRRENYRKAFAGFDPEKAARFGKRDVERLLKDAGLIRNRQKLEAAVTNAKALVKLRKEFGSFAGFCLSMLKDAPRVNKWKSMEELPASTDESVMLSTELKRHGFKFVGPTTVYAHMQALGFVNDHTADCFRYCETVSKNRREAASYGKRRQKGK